MTKTTTDPKAAAIHRERADRAYVESLRFRDSGRESAAVAALEQSRTEDSIAYMLETGREAPKVEA